MLSEDEEVTGIFINGPGRSRTNVLVQSKLKLSIIKGAKKHNTRLGINR